jgi:protocatechuate 3,4-dioxygenase beta subunit
MKKKLSGRLSRKVFKTNFLLTMKAMAIFAFCFSLRVSAAVNPEDNKPANLADEANSSSAFQQLTITGSVTDANTGEPLPGVNIVIEGTTMGAITEADGNYSIDVPSESAVLVFSYVGYTTQRVETSGRTQINIFLSS